MKNNPRKTQSGPSYSPSQMTQGNPAPAEDKPSRQRPAFPTAAPAEEDARECAACLGED